MCKRLRCMYIRPFIWTFITLEIWMSNNHARYVIRDYWTRRDIHNKKQSLWKSRTCNKKVYSAKRNAKIYWISKNVLPKKEMIHFISSLFHTLQCVCAHCILGSLGTVLKFITSMIILQSSNFASLWNWILLSAVLKETEHSSLNTVDTKIDPSIGWRTNIDKSFYIRVIYYISEKLLSIHLSLVYFEIVCLAKKCFLLLMLRR